MEQTFIKLKMNDWVFNAGIAGFCKILRKDDIKQFSMRDENFVKDEDNIFEELENSDNLMLISKNKDEIYFSMKVMEGFTEKYFDFFNNVYGTLFPYQEFYDLRESCENWLKDLQNFDQKNLEDLLSNLNQGIDFIKKKLSSNSYKATFQFIENREFFETSIINISQLKIKLTKKENIEDKLDNFKSSINSIIRILDEILKDQTIRYFRAKDIVYNHIDNFYSNHYLTAKKAPENDPYVAYKKEFVDNAKEFLLKSNSNRKDSCSNCGLKIIKGESEDLCWLNSAGIDYNKKKMHFYNSNPDIYICPVCKLIYSCIPAGFKYANKKGVFINYNTEIEMLIKSNEIAQLEKNEDLKIKDLEQSSYFAIAKAFENDANTTDNSQKQIENIQIVRMDSNNEARPFTFNILDKEKTFIIYKSSKILSSLTKSYIKIGKDYIDVYEEVISRIFNNKSLYDLLRISISMYLTGNSKNHFQISQIFSIQKNIFIYRKNSNGIDLEKMEKYCKNCQTYKWIKTRHNTYVFNKSNVVSKWDIEKYCMNCPDEEIWNNVKDNCMKEGINMDKQIENIRFCGERLREKYIRDQQSGTKKIESYTYKALNALKSKNATKFLDIIIKAHMNVESEIPRVFAETLKDDEKLSILGYAFIVGFLGNKFQNKDEDKKEN